MYKKHLTHKNMRSIINTGDIMERKILHVDVNNAFLSWTAVEMLKNGSSLDIRTIPAVIGGDEQQRKGIVLAKSNLAKQVGIKTGEPIYYARKKCPNLQVYKSDFKTYQKYSEMLYKLLLEYTNKIERYSIDECFLDMTNFIPKGFTLLDIGNQINERVKQELGFTVNVGVAHNKLLAKMASDFQKPDKVHTLFEEDIENKMWRLPISELFMVGKKSALKLEKLGIKTIKDLANMPKENMTKKFGKYGSLIWEYANGIDFSEVQAVREVPKGIGNSATLPYDISNIEEMEKVLLVLVEQVSYRLRKHKLLARVVNVQVKNKNFETYSHQRKMSIPTDSTKIIYEEAKTLLTELCKGEFIRLIGVRVDNLSSAKEVQISIFDNEQNDKQKKLDKTIDILNEKYGWNKVSRATSIETRKIIKLKEE